MPVWSVAGFSAKPEFSISDWQMLETQRGLRHFVGTNVRNYTGRISIPI